MNIPNPEIPHLEHPSSYILYIANIPHLEYPKSPTFNILNIPPLEHPTYWWSHFLNIPHPKHFTCQISDILNILHLKHTTSQISYIPSILYPKHCIFQWLISQTTFMPTILQPVRKIWWIEKNCQRVGIHKPESYKKRNFKQKLTHLIIFFLINKIVSSKISSTIFPWYHVIKTGSIIVAPVLKTYQHLKPNMKVFHHLRQLLFIIYYNPLLMSLGKSDSFSISPFLTS